MLRSLRNAKEERQFHWEWRCESFLTQTERHLSGMSFRRGDGKDWKVSRSRTTNAWMPRLWKTFEASCFSHCEKRKIWILQGMWNDWMLVLWKQREGVATRSESSDELLSRSKNSLHILQWERIHKLRQECIHVWRLRTSLWLREIPAEATLQFHSTRWEAEVRGLRGEANKRSEKA